MVILLVIGLGTVTATIEQMKLRSIPPTSKSEQSMKYYQHSLMRCVISGNITMGNRAGLPTTTRNGRDVCSVSGCGFALPYVDLWEKGETTSKSKKNASKTKYTCPGCGRNAWAKPDVRLICGDCEEVMEAEDTDQDQDD